MLIVVARLGLPEMVGQFALSMAVTTPVIMLLGMDLRTVQATDQSNQYPFADLFTLRVIALSMAMAVIVGFTLWNGYKQDTALLILVMGLAKCVESLSDLCHGTLQQYERLDQMARARILRGLASVAMLAAGLYAFNSLMIATVCMSAMWLGILICHDWPLAYRLLQEAGASTSLFRFRPQQLWQLLLPAIPTGLLTCQASLEQTLPRLFVDGYLGERELGVYSAVSSLVIASTMVINAVHCAVLPRLAKFTLNQQWKQSWQLVIKLGLFGGALGIAGMGAVWLLGAWVLNVAFGPDYAAQSPLLLILMLAATIRYATLSLSTGIRAARRFWQLSILQTISLVATIPFLIVLVGRLGALGAAYATVVMAVLFAVLQIPATLLILRSNGQPAVQQPTLEIAPFDVRGAA
jgi:O-antigen/teichoic acid export membrane protein